MAHTASDAFQREEIEGPIISQSGRAASPVVYTEDAQISSLTPSAFE
jgi:hypothetical protein